MQIDLNTVIQLVTAVATIAVAFAIVQYKTEEGRKNIEKLFCESKEMGNKLNTLDNSVSRIDNLKEEVIDIKKDVAGVHDEISVINITHGKMEVDIAYIKTSLIRIEQKLDEK